MMDELELARRALYADLGVRCCQTKCTGLANEPLGG
jgi:hypothetical protein